MSQGWISLHRTIFNNWVWDDKPFSRGQAWVDILLLVNHEEGSTFMDGQLVDVSRGEHITSEVKLAERWGWSRTKVRNFLDLLQKDGMILNIKEDRKRTRLRVLNYNDYQDTENNKRTTKEQEKDNRKTTEEQQKNINNNENNENNDNKNIYSLSPVPYEKISKLYNTICKSLPRIQKLTDKRKRAIKSRWTKTDDLTIYTELFKKAEESDFLSGRNGKWTGCNFDWLINENNMIKVLEGSYDNKESQNNTTKKTGFHNFEQRTAKYTNEELEEIVRKKRFGQGG